MVGRCLEIEAAAARVLGIIRMKRLLFAALFAVGLAGITHAQDLPTASNARVGPRDILEIKVLQDERLNTRATVSDDGQITMPQIGKIDVSGLSAREVEARVKSILEARYLTHADVSV